MWDTKNNLQAFEKKQKRKSYTVTVNGFRSHFMSKFYTVGFQISFVSTKMC